MSGLVHATITLPGIAGFALTVGMAVDANILIFERIREEIGLGKSIPKAIDAGFDRVFWTIVDSHVTQLFAALLLFIFGTGPVKGFAVSLTVGVVACHPALMGGSCRLSEQIGIVDQGALGDASCTTQDPLRRPVSQARQPTTGEDRQRYPELMEERAHTSVYPGVDFAQRVPGRPNRHRHLKTSANHML